jgi:hypothetical protein
MGKLNNNESASHYIHWCADMANKQNVGVPWIMCQQDDDVPPNVVINFPPSVITLVFLSFGFFHIYIYIYPQINTCNGFYCHDWFPNRTGIQKIWTENWTGW